jgi:glycosyltransferase involved in cell wall biosynthesis
MVVRLFHPWVGGAERQAEKLSRQLQRMGVDARIVTGWWYRGTPQREIREGLPVFRNQTLWEMFGIRGMRWLGGYLYLASLLWYLLRHRGDYDVLHCHSLGPHAFAVALAGRIAHKPSLVKLANAGTASDIRKMRAGQQLRLSRLLLPIALRCDRFVATNPAIAEELVAAGVARARIERLANGVETDEVVPRSSYSLRAPARVLYLGRLHEQKGVDLLIEAFGRLALARPDLDVRLRLVGDGPLRKELALAASRTVARDRIEFTGLTDDVASALEDADVFVLPSRAEGISNALLEAMAHGLPVLVSDVPGNRSVVEHERNGLIFPSGDAAALARALRALLDAETLRERLGRGARVDVEDRFSLRAVAERYVELYEELVQRPGGDGAGRRGRRRNESAPGSVNRCDGRATVR